MAETTRRNIIQIRRGSGAPGENALEPYELGYDEDGNKLYIGQKEGPPKEISGSGGSGGGGGTSGTCEFKLDSDGILYMESSGS